LNRKVLLTITSCLNVNLFSPNHTVSQIAALSALEIILTTVQHLGLSIYGQWLHSVVNKIC